MTLIEQNTALAEMDGWVQDRMSEPGAYSEIQKIWSKNGTGRLEKNLPNYRGSLDQQQSITHWWTVDMLELRIKELIKILNRELGSEEMEFCDMKNPIETASDVLDAPAEWHAEAILRAAGKWKGEA